MVRSSPSPATVGGENVAQDRARIPGSCVAETFPTVESSLVDGHDATVRAERLMIVSSVAPLIRLPRQYVAERIAALPPAALLDAPFGDQLAQHLAGDDVVASHAIHDL